MKPLLLSLLLASATSLLAEDTVTLTNPPPPAFTETKPGYLYFKEGTFSRVGTNRLLVDLTLCEPLPSRLSDVRVAYHIVFDIDSNKATGTESTNFPGFGWDISAYIIKPKGSNRFDGSSSELKYKNRTTDIRVSKLKVSGDKVTCELSSELFGAFDQLRGYAVSYQSQYDGDDRTSKTWVDQLPRKSAFKLTTAP